MQAERARIFFCRMSPHRRQTNTYVSRSAWIVRRARLEDQFHRELTYARIERAGDRTEGRGPGDAVWGTEIRRVQQVEHLGAHLDRCRAANRQPADQRDV